MERTTQFLKRIEEKFKKFTELQNISHFGHFVILSRKQVHKKQNKIKFLRWFSVSFSIIGWIEMVAGGNMKLSHFLILFQYSPIFRDISRYSFLSRFLATISSLTSTSVRKPVRTKPWFLHLDWHCHWSHWLLVNPTYGCALHPPPPSYYSSPAQCSSSSTPTPPPPPFLLDLH